MISWHETIAGLSKSVAGFARNPPAAARSGLLFGIATLVAACAMLQPPKPEPEPEPEPELVNWIFVRATAPEPDAVKYIDAGVEPESVQYVYTPLPEPEPVVVLPDADPVQWIEVPKITRNDWITLLPKADGSVGAVVVRQNGVAILLNKAFATAHIQGEGLIAEQVRDETELAEEFGAALVALPARPAKFLLYFLEGKDEFTTKSEREIERVFAELATRPAPEISVIGHTDAVGGEDFNDKLSLQRAERVQVELIRRGIGEEYISIAGRGERELLVPTSDGVAEPDNRRVEINVR